MRIVLCDRCGGKIAKGETIGHLSAWYEDLKDLDRAKPEYNGWDFCPTCMESINSYIKGIICMPETEPAGSIADDLEEELDTEETEEEPDIESEKDPISDPINDPEPKEEPRVKVDARKVVRNVPVKEAILTERWDEAERVAAEEGPDAKSHLRKKADWPKFKACIDAGKNDKWLAVEFGVTTRTIWTWKKKLAAMGEIK